MSITNFSYKSLVSEENKFTIHRYFPHTLNRIYLFACEETQGRGLIYPRCRTRTTCQQCQPHSSHAQSSQRVSILMDDKKMLVCVCVFDHDSNLKLCLILTKFCKHILRYRNSAMLLKPFQNGCHLKKKYFDSNESTFATYGIN